METEYIHDIIKQRLFNLTETFTLPAYQEPQNTVLKQYIPKYNIAPQEAYNVLNKLDTPPSQITKDERVLRTKYLELVKKITIDDFEFMKANVGSKLGATTMTNMESVRNLTLYVLDLMLTDIDNIDKPKAASCPACPTCPTATSSPTATSTPASSPTTTNTLKDFFNDKKNVYIVGGVVGLLLVLLLVILLK